MKFNHTLRYPFVLLPLFILAACSSNQPSQTELSPKEKFYRDHSVKEVRMHERDNSGNMDSISANVSRIERYSRDGRLIEEVSYFLKGPDSKPTLQRRLKIYQLTNEELVKYEISVEYTGNKFHLIRTDVRNGIKVKKTEYEVYNLDTRLMERLDSVNLIGITESDRFNFGHPSKITEYIYDDEDLVLKEKVYIGGGDNSEPRHQTTIDYFYDDGLIVMMEYNDVEWKEIFKTISLTYNDNDSLLSSITRDRNGVVEKRFLTKYDTLGFAKIDTKYLGDDTIPLTQIFSYNLTGGLWVDSTLYYTTGHNYSGRFSPEPDFHFIRRTDKHGQVVSILAESLNGESETNITEVRSEYLDNGLVGRLVGHDGDGQKFGVVLEYLYY